MEMMFSWLKYLSSFISRSVRRQNMEWSKGVIFLMATFWPDGLCSAELSLYQRWCPHGDPWWCSPYYAVCAFADYILDVVLLRYVEGYLPRAAASCWRHVCGWCRSKRLCAVVGAVRSSSARRGAVAGRGVGEQRDAAIWRTLQQLVSAGVEAGQGGPAEDVSFAPACGSARSHGETVERSNAELGPTLL
jgi:hypothetical protein